MNNKRMRGCVTGKSHIALATTPHTSREDLTASCKQGETLSFDVSMHSLFHIA